MMELQLTFSSAFDESVVAKGGQQIVGFILTTIISILMGILVSMNIYFIRHSKLRIRSRSLLSGSSLSIISSVCSSCSSVGFLLISTFGSIGVIASNLLTILTIYQIPLRIISVAILFFALYTIHKMITQSCAIEFGGDSIETNQKYQKDSETEALK